MNICKFVMHKFSPPKGFTLLELLVVIAIIAVLSVILFLIINPAEVLRKSRDAQRMSDLSTLSAAIGLYKINTLDPKMAGIDNFGCKGTTNSTDWQTSDYIYYSYPSDSPGSLISSKNFDDMTFTTGGPHQVIASNLGLVNGLGWLPINFTSIIGNSPISNLPIDPVNTIADPTQPNDKDLVYRYICLETNLKYEINATLESIAYTVTENKMAKDGGNNINYYEIGTDLTLFNSENSGCVANCTNKNCGDDGCGSFCGTCDGAMICNNGVCESAPISNVAVYSVNPSLGYNTGSISLSSIVGTGFLSGALVKLSKIGQPDISCTGFTITNETLITGGSCHTTSAATGTWDLVVTNADAGTGSLLNGLTVNTYSIGDTGPAGGKIFYINSNYAVDGWRYLEVAPSDQSTARNWIKTALNTSLIGALSTAVGTGLANSTAINNYTLAQSTPSLDSGAGVAESYSVNGFSDWFLPSQDELNLIRTNVYLHDSTGFLCSSYWSSSEVDASNARRQSFSSGTASTALKSASYCVRSARRFWLNPTYTITYNGNGNTGGTISSDANLYQTGDVVLVALGGDLSKDGYTFNGWNTAADGTGTNYAANSTFIMASSDVILYAQWYTPNFTLAFLPDTQTYIKDKKNEFTSQISWLISNKDVQNIKYVGHAGDIVQFWDGVPTDWAFAQTEMNRLTAAGIDYSTIPGNHDYAELTRNSSVYNSYFPLSSFQAMPTYGGAYDTSNDNTYHLLDINGNKLLVLSLEFGPRDAVVAWANNILQQYSSMKAIVITHAYLDPYGELLTAGVGHAASNGYGLGSDVNDGDELWTNLIYPNNNIAFVISGHDGLINDGSALRSSVHADGSPVYQIMANYQYYPVNNAGYLLLLNFSSTTATLHTYSPWQSTYKNDIESQASWSWSF